jgi:ribosomal protein S27AE
MKIELTQTLLNGIRVTLEVEDPKNAFHALAVIGEALSEGNCGKCGSDQIKMEHRRVQENDFFGWKCQNCGAQLDMGQHKTGKTLFAKRTLPDGKYDTQNRGWYHFTERRASTDGAAQAHAAPPPFGGSAPQQAAQAPAPKQESDGFF